MTEQVPDFVTVLEAAVQAEMRRQVLEIEQACEAALQGGVHGVFILYARDGQLISAAPNPYVPYGYIYESRTG